ncbi:MAG: hypothetical protein KA715_02350 [Xanthomonadaceae bacterium]|nr:hypothetical protein [Xanthomonadaceae bacterium]
MCTWFLSILIFSSTSAFAIEEAIEALKTDILRSTKVIDHSVKLFHWRHGPLEHTPDSRRLLFKKSLEVFWSEGSNEGATNLGKGMYFATDPAITRTYGLNGGTHPGDWLLLEINTPGNFKVLDIRRGPLLAKKTQRLLENSGCVGVVSLQTLFLDQQPACREILRQALAVSKIDGVNYSYESFASAFGLNENPGAFLLIGRDLPNRSSTEIFVKEMKPNSELEIIKSYIEEVAAGTPWPGVKSVSKEVLNRWVHHNLYGFESPHCSVLLNP